MLQYTSEKTVKSLINSGDCGKIDFHDIKIDTTKIIYSLITHELYHIIIDIPYKTKKDNIFFLNHLRLIHQVKNTKNVFVNQ